MCSREKEECWWSKPRHQQPGPTIHQQKGNSMIQKQAKDLEISPKTVPQSTSLVIRESPSEPFWDSQSWATATIFLNYNYNKKYVEKLKYLCAYSWRGGGLNKNQVFEYLVPSSWCWFLGGRGWGYCAALLRKLCHWGDLWSVHILTLLPVFLFMLAAENVTAQLSDPATRSQDSLPRQTLISLELEAKRDFFHKPLVRAL